MIHTPRRSRLLPAVLGLICLALAYRVYGELTTAGAPTPGSPSAVRPAEVADLPTPSRPSPPPLDRYTETLERPLFEASRRPPEPEPDRPSAPVTSLKIKLVGVVISPEGRSALVRAAGAKEIVELTAGQSFQGWEVERIEADRIVLRNGDAHETYPLETEF